MHEKPVVQGVAEFYFRPVSQAASYHRQQQLQQHTARHPSDIRSERVVRYSRCDVYQMLANKDKAQRHTDIQRPGQGAEHDRQTESF